MAFPQVQGSPGLTQTTVNATSMTIVMPAGITAGEKLLAIVAVDGNPTISVDTGFSGTGWAIVAQGTEGTVVSGIALEKTAVGGGGDALRLTLSASEKGSGLTYRLSSAGTISGAANNGVSIDSNPPSHTAPGGAEDILWFAARCGDSTPLGTVAPTNYTNLDSQVADGTAGASTSVARRELNTATEDPGAFTSANEQWVGLTIAVAPAAAGGGATLAADAGSATATGGDAGLTAGRLLQADAGSATATGGDVTLSAGSTLTVLTVDEQQLPIYDCDPWGAGLAAVAVTGTHDAPGRVAQYRIHDATGTLLVDWTDFTLPAGTTWSLTLNRAPSFGGNKVTVRGKVETGVTDAQANAWWSGRIIAVLGQSLAERPFAIAVTATLTPTADRLWVLSNGASDGSLAAGFVATSAASVLGRRRAAELVNAYGDAPIGIVMLTEVGTGRGVTANAEEVTDRSWDETMQDPVDYVRSRGSDCSLVIDHWFTADASSWSDAVRHWAPFYLRQQINGIADNPDASGVQNYAGGSVQCVPGDAYTPVHFVFDLTGGGQGLFDPARTKWVPAFGASHTGSGGRADGTWYTADEQKGKLRKAFEVMGDIEAAYQPITLRSVAGWSGEAAYGAHLAEPAGTHVATTIDGEPLAAISIMTAALRAYGRLPRSEPRITSLTVAADGTYADVIIGLPHGGDLSTPYKQHAAGAYAGSFEATNWVAPSVLPETSIPELHNVQGFFIDQGGSVTFSGFTAEIGDPGTGTVPSRTGKVRITPTVPFVNGDKIGFGYADGHNLLTGADVTNGKPHLHWPIETRTHVSATGYGWPVVKESGDIALFTLSGITGQKTLLADPGSATATGGSVTLTVQRRLQADAGAAVAVGGDASLTAGRRLGADAGGTVASGGDVSLSIERRLAADAGTATATGGDVVLSGGATQTVPVITVGNTRSYVSREDGTVVETIHMRDGDTGYKLRYVLRNEDGSAIDLTGAVGVRLLGRQRGSSTKYLDIACTVVSPSTSGAIEWSWSATTSGMPVIGATEVVWEIDRGAAGPHTVPAYDYIEVICADDIG